jgi:polysaccharide export outer membrane protein
MKLKNIVSFIIVNILSLVLLTSCINTKKVTYFNNIGDTLLINQEDGLEPIIQRNDLLSISVTSLSPEVTAVFNTANSPSSSSSSWNSPLAQAVGYLVNQDGYIDFPILGSIKADGLTKKALKDAITKKLVDKKLLFDPIVTVRYLNFHVTVLGEVNHPGLVNITNEQVTVLEAIGMAGDLTIYGKRNNVLLLRKEFGKKVVRRINLNSEAVLSSPFYYLKSNDVIYIEPSKNKVASVSQGRELLPIIFSGLSFLTIILDRVFR